MPLSPSIESKQIDDGYNTSDLPQCHSGLRGLIESRYIVGIALFSTLGGFLVGYDQGIINSIVAMQSFGAAFPDLYTNVSLTGWCVVTPLLAAMLGTFINAPICDKIGRRKSIQRSAVIFLIGSSLQTGATSSTHLFAGRAISGWAFGALTHAIPMYIAEISTANVRGSLVSLQQLAITVGLVVGYWITYDTSHIGGTICAPGVPYTGPLLNGTHTFNPYNDVPSGGCTGQTQASWRVPFGLQLLPAVCLGIGMFFMPYSPRWLLEHGFEDKSLQTLSRLRQKSVDDRSVRFEYLEIMADVRYAREVTSAACPNAGLFRLWAYKKKSFFTTRKMFKRQFVGSLPLFFQQNMFGIIYFAPMVFGQLGLTQSTIFTLFGFYGLVNILATLPAVILVDRVGRRPLLIFGAIGCFVSLVAIGTLATVYGKDLPAHRGVVHIVVAFLFLYNISFSCSWGPIGWVIPSEIYPIHLRSVGLGFATVTMWNTKFIVVSMPNFLPKSAGGLSYFITAGLCLFGIPLAIYFFPETKGLTLEETDHAISKHIPDREREQTEAVYRELGLPLRAFHDAATALRVT